jgi:hypothetical protein
MLCFKIGEAVGAKGWIFCAGFFGILALPLNLFYHNLLDIVVVWEEIFDDLFHKVSCLLILLYYEYKQGR